MSDREILLELIYILLGSCTEVYNDGVVEHEHNLFDNVDKERLKALALTVKNSDS